ncbi:putative magnesium transporter MRS2 [Helianthus annuus]|nr:putative magnesium transporter MRS2 [Helianthus annuus]
MFAGCLILRTVLIAIFVTETLVCSSEELELCYGRPKRTLATTKPASATNLRDTSYRPSASGRQPFQGVDVLGLKKRGQGLRSWIRVDAATGESQIIEVDKFTIMRRCDLPARDLRLLDPLFVYPSTILGREKAIVVTWSKFGAL